MKNVALPDYSHLYDVVCCSEQIDYMKDKEDYIEKCIALVKPGGYFVLS